jgi:hypothetical protein
MVIFLNGGIYFGPFASGSLFSDDVGNSQSLKDSPSFGAWSRDSAAYCIKQKLMVGNQGMAEPDRNITRAEAVVMVMRMLQTAALI